MQVKRGTENPLCSSGHQFIQMERRSPIHSGNRVI